MEQKKLDAEERGSPSSSHLREDIASTRAALGEKLEALEEKARDVFDLDRQMEEHPWIVLGASTGAGFVLGSLLTSPRVREKPLFPEEDQVRIGHVARSEPSEPNEIVEGLKVAAFSLLAGVARQALKKFVPALGGEVERIWNEQGLEAVFNRRPSSTDPFAPRGNSPGRKVD